MQQDNNQEKPCWIYIDSEVSSYADAIQKMTSKLIKDKETALFTCLKSMLTQDSYPDNLMIQAINHVNPCDNVTIKKMLLIFWEVIEKKDKQNPSELKQEFILVCNSIRKDLTSPNEYVRGRTLKLVSKLPIPSLFESIRSCIFENLTHGHSYVRKNALNCIVSMINFFGADSLPEDIPATLKDIIENDKDLSTRRNAYIALSLVDIQESLAVSYNYILNNDISELNDMFLLSVIKNLRVISKNSDFSSEKVKIIKIIVDLSLHKSQSVQYEIATSLLTIVSNQSVVRQAINILSNLLLDLNDSNLILVIINKLNNQRLKYKSLLEENISTYCNIITKNPTQRIRNILFDIVNDLINESNINQVFDIFQKYYSQNHFNENALSLDFKLNILNCFFNNIVKYESINRNYILFLLQKSLTLDDPKGIYADERSNFIKTLFEIYSSKIDKSLIEDMISKIISSFEDIFDYKIFLIVFYVLSEYAIIISKISLYKDVFNTIINNLGDLSFELKENNDISSKSKGIVSGSNSQNKVITKTVVLEDGTYGTKTTIVSNEEKNKNKKSLFLRETLLNSNYFFSGSLAACLTKVLFYMLSASEGHENSISQTEQNEYYFNVINILCSLLKLDSFKIFKDKNNIDRINMCIELILNNKNDDFLRWIDESRSFYIISNENKPQNEIKKKVSTLNKPGDFISFRHVVPYEGFGILDDNNEEGNEDGDDFNLNNLLDEPSATTNKKKFIISLTGTEDQLQIEANIEIFTYDIIIEFYIKNKTKQDYQNVTISLYAPTNLEIIENVPNFYLSAGESTKVKSCIKFSNSCNSFIFGEVSYSNFRGQVFCLNLSAMFINLFNSYAASCTDTNFRKCWLQYSWEHKTYIISKMKQFSEVIEFISNELNLKLIYPTSLDLVDENLSFSVFNLYTKSKLGEDALINISIEKVNDKKIVGTAMIRSKVKEFATFLGERIRTIII